MMRLSLMNLSDEEETVLSKGQSLGGTFKVLGNIKRICKGNHKEVLKSLEDKGLIEMVHYGQFILTEKAFDSVIESVSCVDCNREFDSKRKAMQNKTIHCRHENLSLNLDNWQK